MLETTSRDLPPTALGEALQMPVLTLEGVDKSFGAVQALSDVTVSFLPGRVHAIVGENGAGKSTLIGAAAGNFHIDSGQILWCGQAVRHSNPSYMQGLGISVVYQHPSLVPDLTIYENLQLAAPALKGKYGLAAARAILEEVGPGRSLPLGRRVSGLSLPDLHLVEIARALVTNPKLIFFDEPTEPFQQDLVAHLFELIRRLRDRGVAVVYVSHRLHEVAQIAEHITVMRDGRVVSAAAAESLTTTEIISLIAGRPIGEMFPSKAKEIGDVILETRDLHGIGFEATSIEVKAGEILGLAGIEGEGQRQFVRAAAGIDRPSGGQILVAGTAMSSHSPGSFRDAGIRFVSDDRHHEGLFMSLNIRENLSAPALALHSSFGIVIPNRERTAAQRIADAMRVKAPSIESSISSLSGGNQQKVVLGRELAGNPRVIFIDEPTKGVDVGARSEIYRRLREMANDGIAVIVTSSDGFELEGLCDRVMVFSRGAVSADLRGTDVTDMKITEANMTASTTRRDGSERGRVGRFSTLLENDQFLALVLLPVGALVILTTQAFNPFFLSTFSINSMLLLAAIIVPIAVGQALVVIVGGIDLSVGALAGLCVVCASFLMPSGAEPGHIWLATAAILVLGAAVGFCQGLLVALAGLPSIVVTLSAFIGIQGLSLWLRPVPDGIIDFSLGAAADTKILGLPLSFATAVPAALALEWVLQRKQLGRQLRAAGSEPQAAFRLGVNAKKMVILAFTLCGLLTAFGGLLLAAQVGVGSAVTGAEFTMMSITAVMIGGASVSGGRGSLLATLVGALLVQIISSASAFVSPDSSWHQIELGVVTLAAATLFSVQRWRSRL